VPTFLRRLSTGSWMCFSISSNHMSQTGLVLNSYSWLPSSWLFFSIRSHYPATSSHRTFKSFPMSLSPPSIYALNAHTARLSPSLEKYRSLKNNSYSSFKAHDKLLKVLLQIPETLLIFYFMQHFMEPSVFHCNTEKVICSHLWSSYQAINSSKTHLFHLDISST
jgi:hypothetical protein